MKYACFVQGYTLYDLLWVVGEELAEWGSLGPLQGVEKLLDLCGHSAAHRNSWRKTYIQSRNVAWPVHSTPTLHITSYRPRVCCSSFQNKLDLFFGFQGLISHNTFLKMKRSTRRWQQDEESTVRKTGVIIVGRNHSGCGCWSHCIYFCNLQTWGRVRVKQQTRRTLYIKEFPYSEYYLFLSASQKNMWWWKKTKKEKAVKFWLMIFWNIIFEQRFVRWVGQMLPQKHTNEQGWCDCYRLRSPSCWNGSGCGSSLGPQRWRASPPSGLWRP